MQGTEQTERRGVRWQFIAAGVVGIAAFVLIARLVLITVLIGDPAPSATVAVTYTVEGSGKAIVSYLPRMGAAETATEVVDLPWQLAVELLPSDEAQLFVETDQGAPVVTCRITGDAEQVARSTDPGRRVYATGCRLQFSN